MDAVSFIQSWGAVLSATGAFVAGAGAWRTMGRIEGRVERWSDRLDKHSGAIKDHVVLFARLETLPEKFSLLSRQVELLREGIDRLRSGQ